MDKMMLKKQYMMYAPKKSSSRLPSGFQEVEYIESTGTQYINTNHIFTSDNQKLETQVKFISTKAGRWAGVFKFNVGNAVSIAPYNNKLWFGRNGDYYTNTTYNDGDLLNIKAIAKNQNLTGYVNEQEVLNILYSNTYTPPYNYYLFAQNYGDNNNSPWGMGNSRIYYFRLYENNVIIRDFIPCYRKSDNEVGLYDIVGKQFYTNSGSGSFIKGKDVIYTSTNAVSFATDSWSTIQAEAERISNFYEKYGFIPFNTPYSIYNPENNDTNNIRTITYNNEEIQIAIIGICHDTLQTPYSGGGTKAGITWQTTKSLFKSVVDSSSASGGWSSCSLRASLNSTHFNLLPQEMQNVIKVVVKMSNNGRGTITTSNDKLFTLSMIEIMGTTKRNSTTTLAIEGEGTQYEYYKNAPLIVDSNNITWTGLSGTKGTCIANGNSYMTLIDGVQTPDANDYVNYRNAKEYKPSGSASYYSTRSFREALNECMYVWRTGIISYSPATNKDLEVCFAGCI